MEHTSLTNLLNHVNGGDEDSFRRLVDLVYDDLRRIAARKLKDVFEQPLRSLTESPTDIASRATYILWKQRAKWKNTDQFFAVSARLIHYIVGEYKRYRLAQKRDVRRRVCDNDALASYPGSAIQEFGKNGIGMKALDALESLHEIYPRKAEVFALRAITGHSTTEAAKKIGVSPSTVEKDFMIAKGWLRDYLQSKEAADDT